MQDSENYKTALQRECQALSRDLFGLRRIPESIVNHYVEANSSIFGRGDTSNMSAARARKLISLALHRCEDLEALEFAMRIKLGKGNMLSQKAIILSFLIESDVHFYHLFVNEHRTRFKALLILLCFGVIAIYKWVRGVLILEKLTRAIDGNV